MTRKCILCKETNYKNTYSFFSAPKDPETRKKWQAAIAIDDYSVTDDTYVCSKHFHKDDIITHWVSGIPPHVITIKYKKCRLRPGAVPGRNHTNVGEQCSEEYQSNAYAVSENNILNGRKEQVKRLSGEQDNFLIPRKQIALNEETDIILEYNSTNAPLSNDSFTSGNDYDTTIKQEELCIQDCNTSSIPYDEDQNKINKNAPPDKFPDRTSRLPKYSFATRETDASEDDTSWQNTVPKTEHLVQENSIEDDTLKMEDFYLESHGSDAMSHDSVNLHEYSTYYESGKSEMLFEDLLDIYTEAALPHGWSCMVASGGHATTVVYLCMGVTRNGMPFVEKQVFLKSDMILRCAASNREINPFIHNLVREGKHLRVQSLLDIEELIEEFDQRTICEGICNNEAIPKHRAHKTIYKDGIKWRHTLCPLIVNNDSSRCSRCIVLSRIVARKSRKLLSIPYGPVIFLKERNKIRTPQQVEKRIREHDPRYEYMKICKR